MEVIASLGDGIAEIVGPTFEAYGEILQRAENKAAIKSVQKETHSYGPHERHKLDQYIPPSKAPTHPEGGRPVLVFTYGGAFVMGDRTLDAVKGELVYANLASFFASTFGFETFVVDYRLLSHGAKYPTGGEDIGLALKWIQGKYASSPPRKMYILANSAGAVHVATWLFDSRFDHERDQLQKGASAARLSRVVLLGCPLRLDYNGGMHQMLESYYGNEGNTKTWEPTSLMLTASDEPRRNETASLPPILVAISEWDPDFIRNPANEFLKLLKQRGGRGDLLDIKGHNHISPPLSLGTGVAAEEEWGRLVGAWLESGGP